MKKAKKMRVPLGKPINFVAKHNKHRSVAMRDRTKFQRHAKHQAKEI